MKSSIFDIFYDLNYVISKRLKKIDEKAIELGNVVELLLADLNNKKRFKYT